MKYMSKTALVFFVAILLVISLYVQEDAILIAVALLAGALIGLRIKKKL